MLGWSLKLFRVRGIQLALHSSFLLLLAYVAWEGWQPDPTDGTPGGWIGALLNIGILLAFFTCVVLHELGHSFTAMHFGVGVRRILLMPIGGMAEFDSIPRQPSRELLITLAGPAVNFAIVLLIAVFVRMPANWPLGHFEFAADARGVAQLLLHWNLIMGIFNLVPVFPMDGGRIFRAILATRLPYLRATQVASTVGKILAAAGVAVALGAKPLGLSSQPSYLLAALFAFIFFAGEMEYRSVCRREFEDASWRAMLARYYAANQSAGEPPVLSP